MKPPLTPSKAVVLTGIAWDHSRAFPPLVATAQRYEERHPGVRIQWQKRTLDDFGHAPIDVLAAKFDLIVIDHPWAGYCFARDLVHDLKQLAPAPVLAALEQDSIGGSFASYRWEGKLLALPIDAAAPCPSWRPDLLERAGVEPPRTWAEVLELAERKLAIIPGFNADLFLHFVMLLDALGEKPFVTEDEIASAECMREAINLLKELTRHMPCEIFHMNPIHVAERMTRTDDFAYSAFAYTYNNYARPGFAERPLRFGSLPSFENGGRRLRSVLGGTGIAVSRRCSNAEVALDYAAFVAAGRTQKSIYLHAGGQPSHCTAWNDPMADAVCGGFFSGTRASQEEAFVRPRYDGYVPLQTQTGIALQQCLLGNQSQERTVESINDMYRKTRRNPSLELQIN